MGWSQTWISHAMNAAGLTEALGLDVSVKALINLHGIAPWSAKDLVRQRLEKQKQLSKQSPLRLVPVEEGLVAIAQGGFPLRQPAFIRTCVAHLKSRQVAVGPRDGQVLAEVFEVMDFDKSGTLSLGEFAAGLSIFFEGDVDRCISAVFDLLDTTKSHSLTKQELEEYLRPLVQAMTPPEAEALWPLLLKKATDDIYVEWGAVRRGEVFLDEMMRWTKKGNTIVDRLAEIIDRTVYEAWLSTQNPQKTPSPRTVQPQQTQAKEVVPQTLRTSRTSPRVSLLHQTQVKVVRDRLGSAGFRLRTASMAVEAVARDRKDLHPMQDGDIILAVNAIAVSTPEEYMKLAHGVPEFTVTLECKPRSWVGKNGGA